MSQRDDRYGRPDMPSSTAEFRAASDMSASTAQFQAFATGYDTDSDQQWAARTERRGKRTGVFVGVAALVVVLLAVAAVFLYH